MKKDNYSVQNRLPTCNDPTISPIMVFVIAQLFLNVVLLLLLDSNRTTLMKCTRDIQDMTMKVGHELDLTSDRKRDILLEQKVVDRKISRVVPVLIQFYRDTGATEKANSLVNTFHIREADLK